MASETLRLSLNVPVTGTVKYVDYVKSKNDYADQIAIKGNFDGIGEARTYLHVSVKDQLVKLGIIAGEPAANGSYQVLKKGCQVKILKAESGNSSVTTVELISSSGDVPAIPPRQAHLPFSEQSAPAAAPAQARDLTTIADLMATYEDCLRLIGNVWTKAGGSANEYAEQIASGAHTLFIQRCKSGLYCKTESVPF